MVELVEGSVVESRVIKQGGSLVLVLSKELRDYLKIEEGDSLVIKCESSRKWGNYIGIGKKGKH